MSHKWFSIGLELDVAEYRLKIIETDRQGVEERMRTMLDHWLNNAYTVPSWKVLVDALKAPTVGENRLAKELEDQSILGESEVIISNITKTTCSEGLRVSDMCTPPIQLMFTAVSTLAWQKV